jgi:hypothetical protein
MSSLPAWPQGRPKVEDARTWFVLLQVYWGGRRCFICDTLGACEHREEAAAIAEIRARSAHGQPPRKPPTREGSSQPPRKPPT